MSLKPETLNTLTGEIVGDIQSRVIKLDGDPLDAMLVAAQTAAELYICLAVNDGMTSDVGKKVALHAVGGMWDMLFEQRREAYRLMDKKKAQAT